MTPKSADTRHLLLATARSILLEGEGTLTLDAVARRSGVSKGGLIHHFPNREALVEAIVDDLIQQFNCATGPLQGPGADGSMADARAYVDASLEPAARNASADMARGLIRLFGTDFRANTPFLDPWRKFFARRLEGYRQSGDLDGFARAAVVTLTIESFIMLDVFQLFAFSEPEIAAIKQELLSRFQK